MIFKKGCKGYWKGKHFSKEHKQKIGLSRKGRKFPKMSEVRMGKHYPKLSQAIKMSYEKGRIPYWKDKKFSIEHRKKLSLAKKGKKYPKISEGKRKLYREGKITWLKPILKGNHLSPETEFTSERVKKLWKNKEYRERVIKNSLKEMHKKPTKLEQKFIAFFNENNLPFTYCGNGSLIIEFKNPDFVENNGRKICIEVSNKKEKSIRRKKRSYQSWQEYEKQRIEHFAKFGWKCLVLWEDELKNKELILFKIQQLLEK